MTVAACHPGEVMAQILEAVGVTPTELGRQLHVPANLITQIVNGKLTVIGEMPVEASVRDGCLMPENWAGEAPVV